MSKLVYHEDAMEVDELVSQLGRTTLEPLPKEDLDGHFQKAGGNFFPTETMDTEIDCSVQSTALVACELALGLSLIHI